MAGFVWKNAFNIGVTEIDDQHRHFMVCLNACSDNKIGKEESLEFIQELRDYAAKHFALEEKLMCSVDYIDLKTHVMQHKYFEERVAELETAVIGGENEKVNNLVTFMLDWFVKHILEEDSKYSSALELLTTP